MNVKRWKELRELEKNNPDELRRIAKELGLDKKYVKDNFTAMDVMIAENERDNPERMKNIRDWFK